jgi:hypothetical protein
MVENLRAKYAEMLAMRLLHASGREDESLVRARMAALASRFPGALRELDELELEEIRRRIGRLDAVLQEASEVEPWMEAIGTFHILARGVLAAKKWLDGRRRVDAAVELAFSIELELLPFPEELRGWVASLSQVAAPPRGRVMDLVFARVASQMGIAEREARELVFSPRRGARG